MIEIKNVVKKFTGKEKEVHAVDDVTLTIGDGQIYGIVGYSGAGKSTLVRCINFLETPNSGSIGVSGFGTITVKNGQKYYSPEGSKEEVKLTEKHLKALRQDIGMIFQHFNLLDRSTIYDNVAYPLKYQGKSKEEIKAKVSELLELVDLSDKINAYPSQLSGGQKQRVAIARALANDPKILLSDEATSALDPDATESILNLLKSLNKKLGLTIVMITHEMAVVKQICNRVAVMEQGKVVEEGDVYDVFADPKQAITQNFVNKSSSLSSLKRLREQNSPVVQTSKNSILVKLLYDKDCVGDALISEVSRRYNLNLNIVLASVEMLEDDPLGSIIVLISGESDNIDEALKYIESCRVKVEVIEDGRISH